MAIINEHKAMTKLCVGCGICLGICPVNSIELFTTKNVVTVNFDHSTCTKCGKCVEACPALFYVNFDNKNSLKSLKGIKKSYFCYSSNNELRYGAASGGAVTSIILNMLAQKMVDEVLVVKMDGIKPKPIISHNITEILSTQGSIYFKTFSLNILPKLIDLLQKGKKICIVALPCQISALKQTLRQFEKNIFFIGLICNHTNEQWYLWHLLGEQLPKDAKILKLTARKGGWPGKIISRFLVSNQEVRELEIPINVVWGILPALNISAPLGCLMCDDHLATNADIVAGDAWHPKFVNRNSLGVSLLFSRTSAGDDSIQSCINVDSLFCEPTTTCDVVVTQGHVIIEELHYAPFRKQIFQHKLGILLQLKEVQKILVLFLFIVNYYSFKYKIIMNLLNKSKIKKFLNIIHFLLLRNDFSTLQKIFKDLGCISDND